MQFLNKKSSKAPQGDLVSCNYIVKSVLKPVPSKFLYASARHLPLPSLLPGFLWVLLPERDLISSFHPSFRLPFEKKGKHSFFLIPEYTFKL
jgi:hypothetical protein